MKRRTMGLAVIGLVAATLSHAADGRLRGLLRARMTQGTPTSAATPPGPVAAIPGPGDYRFELRHDGLVRAYRIHVPAGYRRGRPMPVLVALHGGGGNMDLQADDAKYGLVTASDREGFIAVFPNGFSRFPNGRLATWNAGGCCGPARDRNIDDVGFIRRVVADVSRRIDVDARRVYATGMSNGGMMAYRLACEASDVFRAIAPVAGTDNTTHCTPSRPVAVAHFHARDDDHVLFDGGAGPNAFRDASKVTAFTSVPVTIAAWSTRDGCRAPPRRVLDMPGAYCELHTDCAGGARVQVCVTADGGHSWPGGPAMRGKTPSQAISANDLMWRFFDSL